MPLLPYLFGAADLWLSLILTAVVLALSGAIVSVLTRKNIFLGAGRQVALAALAAGVTFGVGRSIGASFS